MKREGKDPALVELVEYFDSPGIVPDYEGKEGGWVRLNHPNNARELAAIENELRKCRQDFDKAVDTFVADYPSIVAKAPERLGKLLKEEWYPKAEDIKAKFSWDIRFYPLPTAGDFRVDLGDETTQAIKDQIEEQSKQAFESAMSDLWTRLHTCVSKIAERLGDPENTVELCDLLPKLNVTGSKELDDMRRKVIADLTKQDPEVLRKNKPARADAAAKAAEILKQMAGFMGGGK